VGPFNRVVSGIIIAALAFPIPVVFAQDAAQRSGTNPSSQASSAAGTKELVAVLEFEAVGATKEQTSAVTDRLEDALLKEGTYDLVDRTLKKKILSEQAFQEAVCTTPGCAVQAGRLLGARWIVAGRLTKIDDATWLVSAQLLDVESGKALKAETIPHKGDYFSLLKETTVKLAARLSGTKPPPPAVPPQSQTSSQAPAAAAATQEPQQQDQSIAGPVMTITGLSLGLFFTAMAQAIKSSDSGSGSTSSSDSGTQILTTFSYISYAIGLVGIVLWVHESNQKSATADANDSGWFVGPPPSPLPASALALQVGYRYSW
jgi:TolB-like protein